MSCILRASGEALDVDALTSSVPLEVDRIWRKGEKRGISARSVHSNSGASFVASRADFDQFVQQVHEVIAFLEANLASVRTLSTFSGVEEVTLDFGKAMHAHNAAVFSHFPPQLVRLAASAYIGLTVSVYACSDDPVEEG